ncbi:MAG TPA: hypothetical protein VG711_04160, partial [Phycisphaerales bacterium]|nr:hypothetical protein [Phycisphaerales bacterium]
NASVGSVSAAGTFAEPKPEIVKERPGAINTTAPQSKGSADVSPEEMWAKLAAAGAKSLRFGSWMDDLIFHGFEQETLKLAVAPSGAPRARFMKVELESFTNFARQALGFPVRIDLDISVANAQPTRVNASSEEIEAAKKIPLVAFAAELFSASIVDVQDAAAHATTQAVASSDSEGSDLQTSASAESESPTVSEHDSLLIDHEEFFSD